MFVEEPLSITTAQLNYVRQLFSVTHKDTLPEVLGVFCPCPPMLGATPGHAICHRASSLEKDLLSLPRGQRQERHVHYVHILQ